MVSDASLSHDVKMGRNGGALPVPDTPETRRLWLGDFKEEELQDVLSALLDAHLVQMTLRGNERGFRLTILGRAKIEAFSGQSLPN